MQIPRKKVNVNVHQCLLQYRNTLHHTARPTSILPYCTHRITPYRTAHAHIIQRTAPPTCELYRTHRITPYRTTLYYALAVQIKTLFCITRRIIHYRTARSHIAPHRKATYVLKRLNLFLQRWVFLYLFRCIFHLS